MDGFTGPSSLDWSDAAGGYLGGWNPDAAFSPIEQDGTDPNIFHDSGYLYYADWSVSRFAPLTSGDGRFSPSSFEWGWTDDAESVVEAFLLGCCGGFIVMLVMSFIRACYRSTTGVRSFAEV